MIYEQLDMMKAVKVHLLQNTNVLNDFSLLDRFRLDYCPYLLIKLNTANEQIDEYST